MTAQELIEKLQSLNKPNALVFGEYDDIVTYRKFLIDEVRINDDGNVEMRNLYSKFYY